MIVDNFIKRRKILLCISPNISGKKKHLEYTETTDKPLQNNSVGSGPIWNWHGDLWKQIALR